MQKLLLSTTALVAFTALAVTAHAAEGKQEGVKLGLGGYYSAHGAYVNQDDSKNAAGAAVDPGAFHRDHDLLTYGEIHFTGEKTFDNGLTTGAKVVLQAQNATSGEQIQENFVYMSGNWGRVELGQNYSPVYNLAVIAPAVDEGIDGRDPDFNFVNMLGSTTTNIGGSGVTQNNSTVTGGNYATVGFTPFYKTGGLLADKVVYYTPRFNGFQAGVSYAPDAKRSGTAKSPLGGMATDNDVGDQSQRLEIGANYETKYSGVGILVGGGYAKANLENTTTGDTGPTTNNQQKDQQSWTGGAQVSYMGFTVGGGYLFDNNGQSFRDVVGGVRRYADGETDAWNAGVNYTTGPWKAGVSYFDSKTDVLRGAATAAVASTEELERWVIGGSYAVAPGVSLGSTLQFHDYSADVANTTANQPNNRATVVTLGTTVTF